MQTAERTESAEPTDDRAQSRAEQAEQSRGTEQARGAAVHTDCSVARRNNSVGGPTIASGASACHQRVGTAGARTPRLLFSGAQLLSPPARGAKCMQARARCIPCLHATHTRCATARPECAIRVTPELTLSRSDECTNARAGAFGPWRVQFTPASDSSSPGPMAQGSEFRKGRRACLAYWHAGPAAGTGRGAVSE